jgi:hypothetical protein
VRRQAEHMNRFGEIADELIDLIEELDDPALADLGEALRTALERACARACEAERSLRLQAQAAPQSGQRAVGRAHRQSAMVQTETGSAVIIQLRAWRGEAGPRARN